MPRTIMMFCGQGAQYHQMGREPHRENPVFRRAMDRCDAISSELGGRAASDIVYSRSLGDSEHFDCLTESNVALLAVGYALAHTLFECGVIPERPLGYSLGERFVPQGGMVAVAPIATATRPASGAPMRSSAGGSRRASSSRMWAPASRWPRRPGRSA